jgi:hypothetical protein
MPGMKKHWVKYRYCWPFKGKFLKLIEDTRRYKTEKAMRDALVDMRRKGHEIISHSEDGGI